MSRVALGALVLAGIALISTAVFGGFTSRFLREKGETYSAIVADAAMLDTGAPVRVQGVEQGRVSSIELRADGRTARVEFELFKASTPLYRDASAAMQFRNALGGNNALNVDRGDPSTGELASREIPLSQTAGQVEVDQILSSLKAPERAGLQTLLREVPIALENPHAPAGALDSVADAAPNLADGIAAVRGRREGDLRRLVTAVDSTVDALDDDPAQLTDVVEGGGVAVETTARRADDIRATVTSANRIMPAVSRTLADLDVTLEKADPLLGALGAAAGDVAPAVRDLRPALIGTGTLLQNARPLLGRLRPAAAALSTAARDGRPLLDALAPSLERIADTILPDLNAVDPTSKRSTSTMAGATLSGLLGAASNIDQVAYMVGLGAAGSERALPTLPCQTYFTDPNAPEVLKCEDIATALNTFLSYNPLDGSDG